MKLPLFTDDMVVYVENPKELTKKLLELISNNGKVAKYKIYIKKSIVFLYARNELLAFEIKKKKIIDISTKKVKYLGVNLTKYVEDLYEEYVKTLMNKVKEDLNKWKDIPWLWIGRLSVVTMPVLPLLDL